MKKLRVVAMADHRDELLKGLLHLGCVEISEPDGKLADPAWAALLKRGSSCLTETRGEITDVNTALAAIKRYAQTKDGMFIQRHPISEAEFLSAGTVERARAVSKDVGEKLQDLTRLQSEEARLLSRKASLQPWASLDMPLEQAGTAHTVFQLGVCPGATDTGAVKTALAAADTATELYEVSADKQQKYYLVICHKADAETVQETLRPFNFSVTAFQNVTGTAAENIQALDRQVAENRSAQEAAVTAIVQSAEARDALRVYADRLNAEAAKDANAERMLTDGTILFFEGWVPAEQAKEVEDFLARSGCAWETADPTEEEISDVPVQLKNNWFTKPLNMVTDMYSLPAYNGVDPNPLMAPFFILFYGMKMADMGYGLLMIAASLFIMKKARPNGPTMRHMIPLLGLGGVSTFIWGALTGGFFGDFLTQIVKLTTGGDFALPALFSPLDDAVPVLIGSLILGVLQVFTGMAVSVYKQVKRGEAMAALCNEGAWYLVFLLGGLAALGVLPMKVALIAIVVVLVIGLSYGKKGVFGKLIGIFGGIYNGVTGYFSDILSYSRLMALMLAGAVVAQVFNQLGAMTGNVITFVIIAMIGNALNFALNLLGCYVHDMRLQCLEFFGRFYEDGGKAFTPLDTTTKYVDIVKNK